MRIRMITGIMRWMVSHHLIVNFVHRTRQTPKGRVRTKVTARRDTRSKGKSAPEFIVKFVPDTPIPVKQGYLILGWISWGFFVRIQKQ